MKQVEKQKNSLLLGMIAALAAVLLMMASLDKCSHHPHTPFSHAYQKAQGDTLDIAIELNPSIYRVHGDSISGHDYHLLQQMSADLGIPIKLHPFVPLSHALDYLDEGLYDIVVASVPTTTQIKETCLMTDPIYLDREVLVQRVDSSGSPSITSQIQLGGDTVWITDDSPIATRIYNLSHEIGDTIFVKSSPDYSAEHLLILVAKRLIDFAVINERIAQEMVSDYPNIDICTPISFTQFQSWAVNKNDSTLLKKLNEWILSRKNEK